MTVTMAELAGRLHALCDAQPFATSWFVKNLVTGEQADRRGSEPVPSASTRKTSIMMAAFKAAHEGRLDLNELIRVEAHHKEQVASGVLVYMTPGLVIPLRDAIVQMIITSDNVCTQLVLDRLELEEINAYCRGIGMSGTNHVFKIPPLGMPWDHPLHAVTTTTPADQGLLLDLILRGARDEATAAALGCSTALCRYALDILSWQLYRQMIPGLLPYGTKVANKTGLGQRGRMDAGIVYRDQRPLYILTAFTDRVPVTMPDGMPGYTASFATIARLSRLCWDAIA